MCGIVGIYSKYEKIMKERLQQATDRLIHRGPDSNGLWVHPQSHVGLGHTRLSVVDLEHGDQPIANENDRIHAVVNGEFYGYQEVQKELMRKGHKFRTNSDSEILLHLYEDHGLEALSYLRGEFAFILWDDRKESLFAARDRFGIKPIFYTYYNDTLLLASEMKALFAVGVPAEWDEESYFQHIFMCKEQSRTLFKGVYQIPPGHYLYATQDKFEVHQYWDLDFPAQQEEIQYKKDEEYLEELRSTLMEAVSIRMVADVPVGCFLSGGIDSSAVLGMAARVDKSIQAFTVTFDHEAYDESPVARETTDWLGTKYTEIPLIQKHFAQYLEETVWHAETLGHNAHGVARYLQSKAVHDQGYKVVLSGDGADELFAGYIYSRLDHILSNTDGLDEQTKNSRLEELLQKNPAFRNVLHASRPLTSTKTCHSLFGYAPSWIQAMELSRQPLKAIFQPSFLHQFSQFDAVKGMLAHVDVGGQLSDRTPVHQGMYTWIKSILPNQILFADRLEMAHGVEVRMPLLDHHVFDVIRRMPVHLLIYGMQEKYALREAARPFVTDKVYKRPKQPFTAPHSTLDPSNPFYELIQDTLRSKMVENIPFISPAAIRALLDSIPKMDYRSRITLDPVLLLLVSTCMIQKLYVSSESTSMMK